MSDETRDRPSSAEEPEQPPEQQAESGEDDTEGHGLERLMAIETLSGRRPPSHRAPKSEDLPPLTKSWPRLRDDRPKG